MPEPVVRHHQQRGKVGMLLIQGTADKVVLHEGKANGYLSAQGTFDYWRKHNGIEGATPQPRLIPGPAGDTTQVSWLEQGAGGASVALLTVRDGGHTWPGADAFNIGLPIGKTTRAVDANDVIWDFFSKHRR